MKIIYDDHVVDTSIKDNLIYDITTENKMPREIEFDTTCDDKKYIDAYCRQIVEYCKNLKIQVPKFIIK